MNTHMKKKQNGFTLVEMVMVVVVVGTLSAVAVPKYIDYKESAGLAAAKALAQALSSAATTNYSAKVAEVPNSIAMDKCANIKSLLTGGELPPNFCVSAKGAASTSAECSTASSGSATSPNNNGVVASTSDSGIIKPATAGICTVFNSTFKSTYDFSYTPI